MYMCSILNIFGSTKVSIYHYLKLLLLSLFDISTALSLFKLWLAFVAGISTAFKSWQETVVMDVELGDSNTLSGDEECLFVFE